MARVWIRELVGALLILAGLAGGVLVVWFLSQSYILEGALLVPLTVVFVGAGIHLFKVALAVRVLLDPSRDK